MTGSYGQQQRLRGWSRMVVKQFQDGWRPPFWKSIYRHIYVYIDYVRRSRSSSCRLLRPINCQTYITLHLSEQKLSYRKQIARQLRTQFVEGIYVTLKSTLRVTQGHWKRNHWTDHTRLTIRRVIGRWILSWPWNVGQRSLEVIEISAIWKLGCGFLFAFYSNYGRICSRLWDIQCQRMAWPWKPGSGSFKVTENGAVR